MYICKTAGWLSGEVVHGPFDMASQRAKKGTNRGSLAAWKDAARQGGWSLCAEGCTWYIWSAVTRTKTNTNRWRVKCPRLFSTLLSFPPPALPTSPGTSCRHGRSLHSLLRLVTLSEHRRCPRPRPAEAVAAVQVGHVSQPPYLAVDAEEIVSPASSAPSSLRSRGSAASPASPSRASSRPSSSPSPSAASSPPV